MAKETIYHSCGHAEETALYGSDDQRKRKEEWLRARPCSICRREAGNRDAAAANAQAGLPALSGSPKQVAWAEKIRAETLASPENSPDVRTNRTIGMLQYAKFMGLDMEEIKARREAVQAERAAALEKLRGRTEAKWWIDYRGGNLDRVVFDAMVAAENKHFGDVLEFARNYEAEQRAKKEAELEARHQAEVAERRKRRAEEVAAWLAAARGFQPASVEIRRDNLIIQGTDGRIANGFIEEGSNEWVVYQIGETRSPHGDEASGREAVRIAAAAFALKGVAA